MAKPADLVGRQIVDAQLSAGDEKLELTLDDRSVLTVTVTMPAPGYSHCLRIQLLKDYTTGINNY